MEDNSAFKMRMNEANESAEADHKCLETAVINNDISFVTATLESGADINSQNADGDTLLHIAIEHDVSYECLNLLLEKGANSTIMNKKGLKPLHVINPESFGTFLNLLKLEKHFDPNDYQGNTVIHFLMLTGADEETMQEVLSNQNTLQVDFNAQNHHGQTPLHLAATRISGEANLEFELSNFDDLNLLQRDSRGDTFLHRYIKYFGGVSEMELLSGILEGKLKACSEEVLKQLLTSKNEFLETPFHLFIDQGGLYSQCSEQMSEKFLAAGADFSTCNIKGETVLHNLYTCEDENLQAVEFIIKNGADVNRQNYCLETPLFHTNSTQIMKLFLDNGANVNNRNKVGKNVLMAKLLEEDFDVEAVETLLEYGADVNARDIHGNTCLHYAAWRNISKEVIQLLKQAGAIIVNNKMGELPCCVAEKRLHIGLIDELCTCSPNLHRSLPVISQNAITVDELIQDHVISAGTVNKESTALEVSDLLKLPYIGSIDFSGEADELKQTVTKVLSDICQAIGERDKLLKNIVFQSGSVGENTKVGLPDEFDFICLIEILSTVCEVDNEKSRNEAGYAYVKLKERHRGEPCRTLFDSDCYLESDTVYLRFVTVLREVISNPDFYTHPHLMFGLDQCKEGPQVPNCKFSLRWTGEHLKDVIIDVDLVPAFQIPSWWPIDSHLEGVAGDKQQLKTDGALILLQMTLDEDYNPDAKVRVSAQGAEKAHMAALPQIARDAYMVSKILLSNRICPSIQLSDEPSFLKNFLTSYMLKNCMFHVTREVLANENANATRQNKSNTLYDIVVDIFKKLLSFAESETLPAFVFPWQNVFTFQEGPDAGDSHISERNKQACMCRKFYAKLILKMLGEDVDFRDCDICIATEPVWRHALNSEEENEQGYNWLSDKNYNPKLLDGNNFC